MLFLFVLDVWDAVNHSVVCAMYRKVCSTLSEIAEDKTYQGTPKIDMVVIDLESDCFEFPPDKQDNQVLAVWGSPSSGKTIMSVKLARYIASQKKNVILVLTDMSAPPLPYICPPSDLEAETSLGNILGAAHVDENLIKQNAILHKKNEYLTMLAMLKGEIAFSYAPYT